MKTRRTKFLLSFFAVAILGFALVNAFTIEVQNRDPFGTLNLSTLRIKPNATDESTMELSGYTLQIRTAGGQINVHKICDENGSGCKEVSTLGIGGSGGLGNSINITGINSKRCRYRDIFLITGNNGIIYEIEAPINVGGIARIDNSDYPEDVKSKYGTIGRQYIFDRNSISSDILTRGIKCTYDNSVGGLGSGITASGTTGNICYLNEDGESLRCDNGVLGVLSGTIAQLVAMFRKTHTPDPIEEPEYEAPAIINTTGANTGYYCSSTDGNTLECDNEVILGDAILTGTLGKRCKYGAIINGEIKWNPILEPLQTIQTGIICMNDEPGGWTINNENNTIYTKNSMPIAIGTDTNSGYTLNVNGSGRIETRFNIGDNLGILNSEEREVYVPIESCPPNPTYITGPTVRYSGTLAFKNDGFSCNNGYIEFGGNGKVGIGGPTETSTKLSIYGHTKIYSTVSPDDRYIELYNEVDSNLLMNVSNIISKWSDMRIGLTGDQEILGISVPSAYIYLRQTNIGINRVPDPSTRNSISHKGYYSPTVQVNGSIQISSEYPISNAQQDDNRMICNQNIEGTIAYYDGNFYGCAKTTHSGIYEWRSLNSSGVVGDSLPSAYDPATSS